MNRHLFLIRNYWDKLKKVLVSAETFRFYWRTYVLSKAENVDPSLYIISYPKCGRTWLRIMLQKYAELSGHTPRFFNDSALVEISDGWVVKFEHDVGNWVPAPPKLEDVVFNKEKYKGKKLLFLIRDPRDVLVSSWYHLKYRENIYHKDLKDFIYEDLVGIKKVIRFFNEFYENREVPADFKVMSYEKFHSDTFGQLSEMLTFAGFPVDEERAQKAVDASKFSNMSKMESSGVLKEPWMKPGDKNKANSKKIRKGKVGGFRQELEQQDIDFLNRQIKEHLHPDLLSMLPESDFEK